MFSNLVHCTHAGDGTDVVCDCDKSGPGQVLFTYTITFFLAHHMTKTKRLKKKQKKRIQIYFQIANMIVFT